LALADLALVVFGAYDSYPFFVYPKASRAFLFFNPKQPEVFGVKVSLREIKRNFSIEIRNFKLWKMPN